MAASKKKSVKRKAAKKKVTPVTTAMAAKPSKAVLLKSAKLELRVAKTTLVQAKRDLVNAQKGYLANPTKGNATTFRNAPGAIVRANRSVGAEHKKVLRLS